MQITIQNNVSLSVLMYLMIPILTILQGYVWISVYLDLLGIRLLSTVLPTVGGHILVIPPPGPVFSIVLKVILLITLLLYANKLVLPTHMLILSVTDVLFNVHLFTDTSTTMETGPVS